MQDKIFDVKSIKEGIDALREIHIRKRFPWWYRPLDRLLASLVWIAWLATLAMGFVIILKLIR